MGYSNTNEFIEKAKNIHGNKYDYSKVDYKSASKKVLIVCEQHGIFEQKPTRHLQGRGCRSCGQNSLSERFRLTKEEFEKKSMKVHGNQYNYSLVKYKNNTTKVEILCKKHGSFWQAAGSHLSGCKCPKCNGGVGITTDDFVSKAKKKHKGKYCYHKVSYINTNTRVIITCPLHGDFEQSPLSHLSGGGCSICGKKSQMEKRRLTSTQFINQAKKVHGDRYSYSKVQYVNNRTKVIIVCKDHGDFKQTPSNHIKPRNCPKCIGLGTSKVEDSLFEFVNRIISCEQSVRGLLKGRFEIDVYIPCKKMAIELNGLYWHSDRFATKLSLLNKTIDCQGKGVLLLHIFDDEWRDKKDIVESIIKDKIGYHENILNSNDCTIQTVCNKDKINFLNQNHIKGNSRSSLNIGLYFKGELVLVMTFLKIKHKCKPNSWKLVTYCIKTRTHIVGGESRLLKYFKKNYKWDEIMSNIDLRWGDGSNLIKLGFKEMGRSAPDYFYVGRGTSKREAKHKYSKITKEVMKQEGYSRIYDCGEIKFQLTK